MKRKDYEPIKFEEFQSTIERWMWNLDNPTPERLEEIKYDLQNKINFHKKEGDWV